MRTSKSLLRQSPVAVEQGWTEPRAGGRSTHIRDDSSQPRPPARLHHGSNWSPQDLTAVPPNPTLSLD